jgi:hypothetical protein
MYMVRYALAVVRKSQRRVPEHLAKEMDLANVQPLAEVAQIQAARFLNRRLKGLHEFESILGRADQQTAQNFKNTGNTKQTRAA